MMLGPMGNYDMAHGVNGLLDFTASVDVSVRLDRVRGGGLLAGCSMNSYLLAQHDTFEWTYCQRTIHGSHCRVVVTMRGVAALP